MYFLLPMLLPLKGTVATAEAIRQLAELSLPGVLAARERFRKLAELQHRELVSQPIARPPLRDYGAEAWSAVLEKHLIKESIESTTTLDGREVTATEPEPVDEPDIEQVLVAADYQGREAERSQLIAYAMNDPEIIGWARVDHQPPTCAFCTMLISRGPVYSSAKTAGDRNRFHLGCTCEVVLVTEATKSSYRGIEVTKDAAALWEKASKGRSGKSVPKAFRELVENRNGTGPKTRRGTTQRAADQAASSADDLRAARVQLDTLRNIRPQNEQQKAYRDRAMASAVKRIGKLEKATPGG